MMLISLKTALNNFGLYKINSIITCSLAHWFTKNVLKNICWHLTHGFDTKISHGWICQERICMKTKHLLIITLFLFNSPSTRLPLVPKVTALEPQPLTARILQLTNKYMVLVTALWSVYIITTTGSIIIITIITKNQTKKTQHHYSTNENSNTVLLLTKTRSTTNPEPDSKFIQSSLRTWQNIMCSQCELLCIIIVVRHWTKFFLKSCGLLVITVHETWLVDLCQELWDTPWNTKTNVVE